MKLLCCGLLILSLVVAVHAARQDEVVFSGAGISRTISFADGLLATNKLEVNGEQVLAQPGVEFMLEFDVNGESLILVPSDFGIQGVQTKNLNRTRRIEIALKSKRDEFPILVFVRYYTNPEQPYVQKDILIKPVKSVKGATLRRVVIEDLVLKPEFGASLRDFKAVNSKSGKGFFFFVASLYGTERLNSRGGLILAQEADHSFSGAYETGRAVLGGASGPVASLDEAFKKYIWGEFCTARTSKAPPGAAWTEIDFDAASAKERVRSLARFAEKCNDARKAHPDQTTCAALSRVVQPTDVHLLAAADAIKVDLATVTDEDYNKVRDGLLAVFPVETLRMLPDRPIPSTEAAEKSR